MCSSHSKFDAYARLNHNGDYSAAAKELLRQGYGDRPKVEYADPALRDKDPSAPPSPESTKREPVSYKLITSKELDQGDYSIEYLIEGTMVAGQPLVIGGPHKSMKTSVIVDGSVSLATGTRMLGRLDVPRAVRVLVMSGESGMATLQETARRIAASKGRELCAIDNLIWTADIPRFGNESHSTAMREMLRQNDIEVLFIDPAYLAMPGADAGNLMIQGEMLRAMGRICEELGVTMVVAHHTKRNTNTPTGEPLELSDIAWAGFAEYFRQWRLVNRRERYEEGTGEHNLWLSVGGSAGHSALWAADISEGVYKPSEPRWWDVNLQNGSALLNTECREKRDEKASEKERKAEEQRELDRTKIWSAMDGLGAPETASMIAGAASIPNGRATAAIGWLVANGMAAEAQVERSNRQEYAGFELTGKALGGGQDEPE